MNQPDISQQAAMLWRRFYDGSGADISSRQAAFSRLQEHLQITVPLEERGTHGIVSRLDRLAANPADKGAQEYIHYVQWLGSWGSLGCPVLRVDAKWAALMCKTSIPEELYDLVLPPWHTFLLAVPGEMGLVATFSGDDHPITRVQIGRYEALATDGSTWWCWYIRVPSREDQDGNHQSRMWRIRLDSLCGDKWGAFSTGSDACKRSLALLGPLIGGACMAFASGLAKRDLRRSAKAGARRGRAESPTSNAWFIGPDVRLDLRADLRSYVATGDESKRGPQVIQSLVRGHWKKQKHGPGNALEKIVHIEPYWRGPEDAPIAVRSHLLKSDATSSPPAR